MAEFRTLRGLITGEEPDEPDQFAYLAVLRIFGEGLDFDRIEKGLGHAPSLAYRKGDRRGPRSPPARFDMWQLAADLPEERPLHEHIDLLWSNVRHAVPFLRDMKQTATVDVYLGYRSNIDHAGVEVPHTSLEIFRALEVPFGLSIIVC